MESRNLRLVVLVLGLGLLAMMGGAACSGRDPEPAPKEEPGLALHIPDGDRDRYGPLPDEVGGFQVTKGAAAGYVPDEACKECHGKIYEDYQSMGMARSFYPPDPDNVIEDLNKPWRHDKTGWYYEMYFRDGKFYQKRYCRDRQGRPFGEYEVEVAWVIGSGNHVRSYISRNPNGELFLLPVSWYAKDGWAMSPGFDRKHHFRFERPISRSCLFCHNAFPEMPAGSDYAHEPIVFPKKLPHGIGCQRCHGPGARHIEKALDEDAEGEVIRERILNPANFKPQRREDLCMGCHLQPDSRGEFRPSKFSRPEFSFRPGDDLAEHIVFLETGAAQEQAERIHVNHHAYRMRKSKCHTASGKLSCLTCHNPHRKVPVKERAEHYRNKCLQCHELEDCDMEEMGASRNPAEADCVSCHMFKARPSDVVHVTITDHWIRRHPPKKDLTAPLAEEVPQHKRMRISPYFARQEKDPLWAVYEGLGVTEAAFGQEDVDKLRTEFEKTKPHTIIAYLTVGDRLLGSVDPAAGLAILEEALRKFPENAKLHHRIGDAKVEAGKVPDGVALLEKARDLAPENPHIRRSLAIAYARLQQWEKACVEYARSLESYSNNWASWRYYAFALYKTDKKKEAAKAFRRAIKLNPDDEFSYRNLARLLRGFGQRGEMFKVLDQAATHLLDVELALIEEYVLSPEVSWRQPARGLARAEEAVRKNPKNPRCQLYLGMARLYVRNDEQALRIIERAHQAGADPASCVALAALYWMQRRDVDKVNHFLGLFQAELQKPAGKEPLRLTLQGIVEAAVQSAGGGR